MGSSRNHIKGAFTSPRGGEAISADQINQMQRRILDCIVAGPGIEVRRTADRIMIARIDDAIVPRTSGQVWVPWDGDSA